MKRKSNIFKRIGAHLSAFKYWGNYRYCKKYPFMKSYNVMTGEFLGYNSTMLDCLPEGWRKAFGQQLVDDLKNAIKKDKVKFTWLQIKEKWGMLCLYANCGDEASKVLEKYELLSIGYCINCGKPAKYITDGYVSYLCEDCFKESLEHTSLTGHGLGGYKHHCRLSKRHLPIIKKADDFQKLVKFDYQQVYGINLPELWGLKKDDQNETQN